jgi:voltage-gated potassium channel
MLQRILQKIARVSGPIMFALSLAFLVCQAVLIVVWVDVPNLTENALLLMNPEVQDPHLKVAELSGEIVDTRIQSHTLTLMFGIWLVVLCEAVFHWITRPWNRETRKFHFYGLLFCICPSLRMCARSPEVGNRIWLPSLGWRISNKRLRKRLERYFSVPMIAIALLIMPVLIVEFYMKAQVANHTWLRTFLHFGTGVIWFAFAAEFILMVSVAEKKLAYCKAHWVDLAIILLPLFSFLRSLQFLRATSLAQSLKIPMLTRMARVYRLRGTALKAFRALILLELLQRILGRNTEREIEKLRKKLIDVEAKAKEIRREIARIQRRSTETASRVACELPNRAATLSMEATEPKASST